MRVVCSVSLGTGSASTRACGCPSRKLNLTRGGNLVHCPALLFPASVISFSFHAGCQSEHAPATSTRDFCLRSRYRDLHFNQSLLCCSQIAMMQSANLWERNDFAFRRWFDLPRQRRIPL